MDLTKGKNPGVTIVSETYDMSVSVQVKSIHQALAKLQQPPS